jgi:hypothetical protein
MEEVWLQANRRVLGMALVPAGIVVAVGAAILAVVDGLVLRTVGWAVVAIGAALVVGLVNQLRRPRIAFRDGEVLFHLRAGRPIAVPHEIVEAFFLGQGPAYLPLQTGGQPETVNLVARLSQKAPEWAHVSVKPALGHWCEGYVTIRGAWCEPLTGDVIRRLNARLRELRTADKEAAAANPPSQPSEARA